MRVFRGCLVFAHACPPNTRAGQFFVLDLVTNVLINIGVKNELTLYMSTLAYQILVVIQMHMFHSVNDQNFDLAH